MVLGVQNMSDLGLKYLNTKLTTISWILTVLSRVLSIQYASIANPSLLE